MPFIPAVNVGELGPMDWLGVDREASGPLVVAGGLRASRQFRFELRYVHPVDSSPCESSHPHTI